MLSRLLSASFARPTMSTTIRYLTGDELAARMKDGTSEAKKDFVVVDVRDDDRAGGHIKDSISLPSQEFLMSVDKLVADTKDVPLVVFHCSLSQVRGPKAARIYAETRKNIIASDIDHEVVILRDGFSQFQVKYKDDPDLVENWDKEVWASDWS